MLGGILSFVVLWGYNLSFQTHLRDEKTFIRFITSRKFLLFAMLLSAIHLFFMGFEGWLSPSGWHGGLPPISPRSICVFYDRLRGELIRQKIVEHKRGLNKKIARFFRGSLENLMNKNKVLLSGVFVVVFVAGLGVIISHESISFNELLRSLSDLNPRFLSLIALPFVALIFVLGVYLRKKSEERKWKKALLKTRAGRKQKQDEA